MNAGKSYKIIVCIEPRDDGGIRVWSDDLPELVLSHSDPERVMADIPRAMEVILSERLGVAVQVEELADLPGVRGSFDGSDRSKDPAQREFAARAA